MTRIFVAAAVLTLANLAWWAWGDRLVRAGSRSRAWRWTVGTVVIFTLMILYLMLGSYGFTSSDRVLPRWVFTIGLLWFLIGLPLSLILGLLKSTLGFAARLSPLKKNQQVKAESSPEKIPPEDIQKSDGSLSRRSFLARATVLTPVVVVGTAAIRSGAMLQEFEIRHHELRIPNLPSRLDGLVIAHISDTHLGRLTTGDIFQKVVDASNDFDADLVLHTGDLINNEHDYLAEACELFRSFRSRYGSFICEGNHDLMEGRDAFRSFVRKERLPILVDESKVLSIHGTDVEVMGLSWGTEDHGRLSDAAIHAQVRKMAQHRTQGAFPILLAHHPHAFDAAIQSGIPLTLAGHTHGGQLNFTPDFGFGSGLYRYWAGVYGRAGHTCVVSTGAGNWLPLRVNAPAEIARVTLRRES